ncbi:MAG: outer membrane protein transport protein [Deltaproteobacteria bacterium]|nr:outer membrane protein transport protein [Deltaproteobacteria bacterium]
MKTTLAKGIGAIAVLVFGVLMFVSLVWGADPFARLEIPSSPNPVGSGARALGMGGAFIAIADDATAASWNPGGLIQLETPEISAVGAYVHRGEANSFGKLPEASGSQSVDEWNLNYLSGAYPFEALGRNMIVSLNYQRLYDFNREWDFGYRAADGPVNLNYDQEGGLYALGLAYSVEIVPSLSAGVTFNYWGDFFSDQSWTQKYDLNRKLMVGGHSVSYVGNKREKYSFSGFNATIGFLWNIMGEWTVGGVFKTPFTADITHKINGFDATSSPTDTSLNTYKSFDYRYDEKLEMPMSYGLGVAHRFSDAFTMAFDLYRTHWDDFVHTHQNGGKTSPISGKPIDQSDIDPTTWARLGAEYLFIRDSMVIPVRAGLFYDPAPAEGSSDKYYGCSVGSGIAYGPYVFDISYQFRFGNNVGKSSLEGVGFSQDVREHTFYFSMVYHF